MINVSKIKEGIVIDHIKAGQGYKIFQQLGLDKINDVVVLMRNVPSEKMGVKDLIKIETPLEINFDILGLIDPDVSVNYIKDGKLFKKVKLTLPKSVVGILKCPNPRCITNTEKIANVRFDLVDKKNKLYACEYCEARTKL
ncbi:MAG: aspartate carbamoyltransferase regulatory subunit [Firmicutes bacterium]|jgi:aspartate carbamoyltransferase regulatory subunit|nr:aspartate carbamoyltransferase regulatory subunit [Bacillota bacterium]MEE3382665.1 aspartate carbamoyltransferase regulatory subunit [Anaerovoracaceae bacterium]MBQ1430007.1 aspartate carbamoyltransferase regulatory subunit [Bacillota bacterium]MBQ1630163.1 aspartate carbamoyltransferase regulatory subunit [Bacillota bacterium]MBQ1715549.1 aspartate carbamoyltransferase regulatory subunit [Bacillota bacterium]